MSASRPSHPAAGGPACHSDALEELKAHPFLKAAAAAADGADDDDEEEEEEDDDDDEKDGGWPSIVGQAELSRGLLRRL